MERKVTPIGAVRIPGSDIHFTPAVKAGNWVFLTGIEAVDYASGLAAQVRGNPDLPHHGLPKHRREGDYICARLSELLREAGTSFANAVRLDQYYPTWKAVDPYHLARHAAFGNYIPPSTSVIMEELLTGGADITTSLLAVMPGQGREPKRVLTHRAELRRASPRRCRAGHRTRSRARPLRRPPHPRRRRSRCVRRCRRTRPRS